MTCWLLNCVSFFAMTAATFFMNKLDWPVRYFMLSNLLVLLV